MRSEGGEENRLPEVRVKAGKKYMSFKGRLAIDGGI